MNFILLVDGDNINPTKMGDILDDIHKRGNLKICRIYADFSTSTAGSWQQIIQSHPVDAIQVYSSRPQSVDLKMSLDGLQYIFEEEQEFTLCLASGDRDFTHLMRKAHKNNCRVIVYATNKHISIQLKNSCDECIHIWTSPNTNDEINADIRQIINQVLEQHRTVNPSSVNEALLRHNPSYTYTNFGHNSFKHWMFDMGYEVLKHEMRIIQNNIVHDNSSSV
ncbi:MAG: NYN domain-containing protein [Anaerolineales bacterium]|nr:NYN domain-containing protein [Anaerolineales bacterium]